MFFLRRLLISRWYVLHRVTLCDESLCCHGDGTSSRHLNQLYTRIPCEISLPVLNNILWSVKRYSKLSTTIEFTKNIISTVKAVPADGLAPLGTRTSADTVMTKFMSYIDGILPKGPYGRALLAGYHRYTDVRLGPGPNKLNNKSLYPQLQQSWKGSILVSPCPSVCPSICPSLDEIMSTVYLPQYLPDQFHLYTSYQSTSEGVLQVIFNSKINKIFVEFFTSGRLTHYMTLTYDPTHDLDLGLYIFFIKQGAFQNTTLYSNWFSYFLLRYFYCNLLWISNADHITCEATCYIRVQIYTYMWKSWLENNIL